MSVGVYKPGKLQTIFLTLIVLLHNAALIKFASFFVVGTDLLMVFSMIINFSISLLHLFNAFAVFRACAVDAEELCHISKGQWVGKQVSDGLLAGCLWSHRHASSKPRTLGATCQREVSRLMLIRASSIDLNPEVFHYCLSDLGKFCLVEKKRLNLDEFEDEDDEEEEEGIACLEDHLDALQVSLVPSS